MKYAIISDIHSNLEALTKALKLIDGHNVDEIICLGDVVGYGANPNECIEIVKDRCSIVLLGNHDAAAVQPHTARDFNHLARRAIEWTYNELTQEHRDYLQTLPFTAKKEDLLFVHASPQSPEQWDYIFTREEAIYAFQFFTEKICFIGHTHIPGIFNNGNRVREISRDERYLINVGSIGQPRDGNPMLSFGIFDTERWSFQLIRDIYDIETASIKISEKGLPQELGIRILYGS